MKKCKKKSSLYLENSLPLESEIRPLKCLNVSSLGQKYPIRNSLCVLCATECLIFEVKAQIKVSVPSGVINRQKSTEFNAKQFLLLFLSVDENNLMITQKSDFKYFDFNSVFSIVPRKGDG